MPNAFVNATAAGATQIMPGVPGVKYRILSFLLSFGSVVAAKFQTNVTDISPYFSGVNGTAVEPGSLEHTYGQQRGHFSTVAGDPLNVFLNGVGVVGVHVNYDAVNE